MIRPDYLSRRRQSQAEYPRRIRLEWLIATARVVMAASGLATYSLSPLAPQPQIGAIVGLAAYLVYSVLILGVVWTPVRFERGSDVAAHVFDVIAFCVLLGVTGGQASPFYNYAIFLVICASLRWGARGAGWTAIAAIGIYGGISWYAVEVRHVSGFAWNTLIIRTVNVAVAASLAGYIATYHRRHELEIRRLVSWPKRVPSAQQALVAEILNECAGILRSPRVLLAWDDPDEDVMHIASRSADGKIEWEKEIDASVSSLVTASLRGQAFSAANPANERGVIVRWSDGTFKQHHGRPLDRALQSRFNVRAVETWPIDGELVTGRLLCLDKPAMRLDDLILGIIVARQAASRLDSLYLLKRLGMSARVEERLRVARDLHDSILQAVAGSAMQLAAACRWLDRDPAAARRHLADVQAQLEISQLEMRAFIGRLRPPSTAVRCANLMQRLDDLCRRVERQWNVRVTLGEEGAPDHWPASLAEELYRIVQEGVLNAARHAAASHIHVTVAARDGALQVEITDNGHGFPFKGTYDLEDLRAANRGPLTMRERVAALEGQLMLRSMDTGSELRIAVPLAATAG